MGMFEDALEVLKKSDDGEKFVDAVLSRINKANDEAKGLRVRVKAAEDAKAKMDGITGLLEDHDIDLDGDLTEQFNELLQKSKTADSSSLEVKKLARQLKKFQEQLDATRAENERLTQVGNRSKIKDKLASVFGERILNSDVALDYRIKNGDILLTDDGEVAYKNGDELVTDNIIDVYIKNNPNEAKNTQKPGGSSSPSGGTPSALFDVEKLRGMSTTEYANLTDDQRSEIQKSLSSGVGS